MKRARAFFAVLVVGATSGSRVAAQARSPQPVPLVTAPAPVPSSQAQAPAGASRPRSTASGLGPIVATGDNAAYVSAESTGHPAVFIGSDASSHGIVGTFTNHPLGFRTNNVARMFIDTTGKVGIGTAAPGYTLDVNGPINGTAVLINGVAVGAGGSQWASDAGGIISYTGGNVGIGTTNPQAGLEIRGTGFSVQQRLTESSSGNSLVLQAGFGNSMKVTGYNYGSLMPVPLYLSVDGANTFLNSGGGNVGIGTTSPTGGRLHVEASVGNAVYGQVIGNDNLAVGVFGAGTTGVKGSGTGDGMVAEGIGNATGIFATTEGGTAVHALASTNAGYAGIFEGRVSVIGTFCAINVSCASDVRLKQNIAPLSYGLREVLRLRPAKWEWKNPSTVQLNFGLVAQDVEPVLPELILRNVDPQGSLGLHYTGLIPVLINAIQEQQDTITALKAENMSLDARIRALEQAVERSRLEQ